jgi:hypothetical protein
VALRRINVVEGAPVKMNKVNQISQIKQINKIEEKNSGEEMIV